MIIVNKFLNLRSPSVLLSVGVLVCSAQAQSIPNAPDNLTASAASAKQVNLSWRDNSTDETGFKVFRSTDSIVFTQVAQVSSNQISYRDTRAWPGTTYYYQIKSFNVAGNSSPSAMRSVTMPALCPTSIVAWGTNNYFELNIPA